ncbi:TPA: fimbrial biogenesis outer membrane usher protein [Klebsiella aerogenes]|nr:fimbrial biogenesis outer membrane usher protein [Klebsiella oxytoca]HCR0085226.1 fimbrial biogenesis outer membrane usher protein [Klebsiella aerogenes]HCR0223724.1 fimbrial biogenesis outer membrane usher protein [Klebsiella aerogenes]HCR0512072.1 fimbrial biogenesis outer membrane usher protein [Klebsiella aerogenes]HCU2336675.1 fimbrial biogenesis outer membrane usher protein [Klebsiella aerogenes]
MKITYNKKFFFFQISIIALFVNNAIARDYFDPGLLAIGQDSVTPVDLSQFEKPGAIAPGIYNLNVFINNDEYGYRDIEIVTSNTGEPAPVITPGLLRELHVNIDSISNFRSLSDSEKITDLGSLIPKATVKVDLKDLALRIRVPQARMDVTAAGAVNPNLLDIGIPGLIFNYNINTNRMWNKSTSPSSNLFSGINGGLNLGAWRLRSNYIYSRNEGGKYHYSNSYFTGTHIKKTLIPFRTELSIGEVNTSSDVFDTFPAKAVMLSSLEQMKPYSLRGFAPVVSGNAETNARVTVLQNDNIVYQTYVSPGPFVIKDLYQAAIGADLTVMIHEADGRIRTQKIAYSSLPNMLRQGAYKYQLVAGEYNNHNRLHTDSSPFLQGTLTYGLPMNTTIYGGILASDKYYSGVLGFGVSMGKFGALSADITQSYLSETADTKSLTGQSYRLRYSKSIMETGTSVDLTAYRYSTKNYYNFMDYNRREYLPVSEENPWIPKRRRSSFQTRISQDFHDFGMFSLAASRDDYWGSTMINNNLSASYNLTLKKINYGISYSIDRIKSNNSWPENRNIYVNVQIPFNLFSRDTANSAYATYMVSKDNHGKVQQQASYNGTLFDSRLSYSAQQSWSNGNNEPSTSGLNFSYQGSKGLGSLGYSQNSEWRSLNVGLNGGLIAHSGGVTFSQTLGSSVALVHAPEATNTRVINGNVNTDSSGYAVVPYLSDFQKNTITLDPTTLPENVDVHKNTINVYPVKDSIVRAEFKTRAGYQAIFTIRDQYGKYIPFGATVSVLKDTSSDSSMFIVGDKGQAYISGLSMTGTLLIRWGNNAIQSCNADYSLENSNKTNIISLSLTCR